MGMIQRAIPGSLAKERLNKTTYKRRDTQSIKSKRVSLLFCLVQLKSIIIIKQNNYDKNKI